MHFEVLVEDASGALAVETFLEKILGINGQYHSYRIHPYRGLGHLPRNLTADGDPRKRILLERLPSLLRGYGRSLTQGSVVLVVVDLDTRDCIEFKHELVRVLDDCDPKPNALFRIAIEEVEAWYFGDRQAVQKAYPNAKVNILNGYVQDSICGTWEKLADALHPGGSSKLKTRGYPVIGMVKCEWARRIGPYMDMDANLSKSFQVFRDGVRRRARIQE